MQGRCLMPAVTIVAKLICSSSHTQLTVHCQTDLHTAAGWRRCWSTGADRRPRALNSNCRQYNQWKWILNAKRTQHAWVVYFIQFSTSVHSCFIAGGRRLVLVRVTSCRDHNRHATPTLWFMRTESENVWSHLLYAVRICKTVRAAHKCDCKIYIARQRTRLPRASMAKDVKKVIAPDKAITLAIDQINFDLCLWKAYLMFVTRNTQMVAQDYVMSSEFSK